VVNGDASKPTVCSDLVNCRAKARKRAEDVGVDLSGVGLASHRVGVGEAKELGHSGV
jgi:hypothetical protein